MLTMLLKPTVLITFVAALSSFSHGSSHTCDALLSGKSSNSHQTAGVASYHLMWKRNPKTFLTNLLSSVSHHKKDQFYNHSWRTCGYGCYQLASDFGAGYQFRVRLSKDSGATRPYISRYSKGRTLFLPNSGPALSSRHWQLHFTPVIRSWLMGHELYPYSHRKTTQGTEDLFSANQRVHTQPIRVKNSQALAIRAFVQALNKSNKLSFLHVGPTSSGKSLVLAKNLTHLIRTDQSAPPRAKHNQDPRPSIYFVTVNSLDTVDQLTWGELNEELSRQKLTNIVDLYNWNEHANNMFSETLRTALASEKPTVFVITQQSLVPLVNSLPSSIYQQLTSKLGGLFIDEAHHLGAPQSRKTLLSLIDAAPSAILYGTTATPVHEEVQLRDDFEYQHFSYLNDKNHLFEERTASDLLVQLSKGIEHGEISPFDDLYIVGEPSFSNTKTHPLFEQVSDLRFSLNPAHYQRFSELISPIVTDNPRGLIVAATIAEADRLAGFLSTVFEDTRFESYHSQKTREERDQIFKNSFNSKKHYIVAVRALDEGKNLPHLSAYIDINSNVSVKQMIHRIGRVVRPSVGKYNSDIFFLADYKNQQTVEDLLEVLDLIDKLRFKGQTVQKSQNQPSYNGELKGLALKREQLVQARAELSTLSRSFWTNSKQSKWMSYEEAKAFVQKEGLTSQAKFIEWTKKGLGPKNLPRTPQGVYKNKGWVDWPTFFGTKSEWMSYEEAKAFVQKEGITSQPQLIEWSKKGLRPKNFPSNPHVIYQNNGWVNFPTFFGTIIEWMSYEEAKALVQKEGITNQPQLIEWSKNGLRPENFPSNPRAIYKDKGWVDFPTFFGINRMSYEEAKTLVQREGITSLPQLKEWHKKGLMPKSFPSSPYDAYKDKGWVDFPTFFGTNWMSYEEAKTLVQKEGITSLPQLKEWNKKGLRPKNFPSATEVVYKGKGWVDWPTFFGTKIEWMSYEEAKALAQKEGITSMPQFKEWSKKGLRPKNFPSHPESFYKGKGWIDSRTFFGTK